LVSAPRIPIFRFLNRSLGTAGSDERMRAAGNIPYSATRWRSDENCLSGNSTRAGARIQELEVGKHVLLGWHSGPSLRWADAQRAPDPWLPIKLLFGPKGGKGAIKYHHGSEARRLMGLRSSVLDSQEKFGAEEERERSRVVQRWTDLVQTLIKRAILRWAGLVHKLRRIRRQQRYFGHLGQCLRAHPAELRGRLRQHLSY